MSYRMAMIVNYLEWGWRSFCCFKPFVYP